MITKQESSVFLGDTGYLMLDAGWWGLGSTGLTVDRLPLTVLGRMVSAQPTPGSPAWGMGRGLDTQYWMRSMGCLVLAAWGLV